MLITNQHLKIVHKELVKLRAKPKKLGIKFIVFEKNKFASYIAIKSIVCYLLKK